MFIAKNTPTLLQVNFPPKKTGMVTNVYYQIMRGDGIIAVARQNSGVVEFGGGCYGITVSFPNTGVYSIIWDIDLTDIKAGEDITVYESFARFIGIGI